MPYSLVQKGDTTGKKVTRLENGLDIGDRATGLGLNIRLVSHTHTHTIDVIVDVRMTSRDVIVGIRMTSLPVYGHTECDTRLLYAKVVMREITGKQYKCQ